MLFNRLCFIFIGFSVLGWSVYLLLKPLDLDPVVVESTPETWPAAKATGTEGEQNGLLVDEVNDLRKALSLLNSQVASLETRLLVRQSAQPSAVPTPEQTISPPEDELDETVMVEREQAQWEEYLDFVESGLQQENIDKQWSSKAKTEIENAFTNKELDGAAVSNIECRTTLCRIEVVHDSSQSLTKFDVFLPQKLAHILPQSIMDRIKLEDGSTSTVVYMSRDGYQLPQTDEPNSGGTIHN